MVSHSASPETLELMLQAYRLRTCHPRAPAGYTMNEIHSRQVAENDP